MVSSILVPNPTKIRPGVFDSILNVSHLPWLHRYIESQNFCRMNMIFSDAWDMKENQEVVKVASFSNLQTLNNFVPEVWVYL